MVPGELNLKDAVVFEYCASSGKYRTFLKGEIVESSATNDISFEKDLSEHCLMMQVRSVVNEVINQSERRTTGRMAVSSVILQLVLTTLKLRMNSWYGVALLF